MEVLHNTIYFNRNFRLRKNTGAKQEPFSTLTLSRSTLTLTGTRMIFKSFTTTVLTGSLSLGLMFGTPAIQAMAEPQYYSQEVPEEQPFSSLNIRLSNRPIIPPASLVVKTMPLTGLSVARPFEGPPPRAVIIEDDQRQRVALISENHEGSLHLYLLEPISLDPSLSILFQCVDLHQCETDRMPLTGGLACVAICLKDILEFKALSP